MKIFQFLMSLYIKENPQYLRECFESLVAQTHPADEIVLVFMVLSHLNWKPWFLNSKQNYP